MNKERNMFDVAISVFLVKDNAKMKLSICTSSVGSHCLSVSTAAV